MMLLLQLFKNAKISAQDAWTGLGQMTSGTWVDGDSLTNQWKL